MQRTRLHSSSDLRTSRFSAKLCLALFLTALALTPGARAQEEEAEAAGDDIQIIQSQDRTHYEYRQNGVLLAIKVVTRSGKTYYLVPPEGVDPVRGLENERHLYANWVIVQW